MYNNIKFSVIEKEQMNFERALFDLRMGSPIIFQEKAQDYLIYASETLDLQFLKRTGIDRAKIILSQERANFVFDQDFEDNVSLDIELGNEELVSNLVFKDIKLDKSLFKFVDTEPWSKDLLNLLIMTELIPSYIMIENFSTNLDNVTKINALNIENYYKNNSESLELLSITNLQLENIKKAQIAAFRSHFSGKDHYAIIIGDPLLDAAPLVRLHSSCYTGDLLGSMSCDCGPQLKIAMDTMDKNPKFHGGIIIYLMQDGRGIGLTNKLRTYLLQESGYDTVEANLALGFPNDVRNFKAAKAMLNLLKVTKLTLLTNNPSKNNLLLKEGMEVVGIEPIVTKSNEFNKSYLEVKADKMGHYFEKDDL